ncbi:IclR family transcriptional regulator [Pararobbsia silviterrae]|uniref:IclR family transcriptional regulator n=1 Tax=Pararobbsia silviterrae TaxID=1792498 RepID=A0A494YBF3_9BURK|nr:helix-turn-helix domain-containing protein [Pararobbsia silviterrae]RKP57610.1 IclR family transcriptional regulator [Pararobbsia silviterrae]
MVRPASVAASAMTSGKQRGIRAMEVGGELLRHLADAGRPVSMAELSEAARLPLNQVFTYVVSLTRTGLVRRDTVTHRLEPGPLLLSLGLHAIALHPMIRLACDRATALAATTRFGVFVSLWADRGPTLVKYLSADTYVHTGLHVGSVMSLTQSSTGRLFAAYLPRERVAPFLDVEIDRHGGAARRKLSDEFDAMCADIRTQGLARTQGLPIPGVDSMSAPIFDGEGQLAVGITMFGRTGEIDIAFDGAPAHALRALQDASHAAVERRPAGSPEDRAVVF